MPFRRQLPDSASSTVHFRALHVLAKRTLDIIGSGVGLVLLAPLMLGIAVAIRLGSSGSAVFVQERLGRYGTTFPLFKFRTMVHGAPDLRNPDGTTVATSNDSRVTRIGRVLRRSSLDELPQLLNVLLGDMSLVGPRPELPDGLARYEVRHLARLDMPPGITGWAAVNGRNDLPLDIRRDLDVWYVENFSVFLDLRVLAMTVVAVFRGTGVNRQVDTAVPRERGS